MVKKKAKQAAALDLLRVLYPHVQLWGQLVESTNSRQKENKIKTKESRAAEGAEHAAAAAAAVDAGPVSPDMKARIASSRAREEMIGDDAPRRWRPAAADAATPHASAASASASAAVRPDDPFESHSGGRQALVTSIDEDAPVVTVAPLARQMLSVTKGRLWERVAVRNNANAGFQIIELNQEPIKRDKCKWVLFATNALTGERGGPREHERVTRPPKREIAQVSEEPAEDGLPRAVAPSPPSTAPLPPVPQAAQGACQGGPTHHSSRQACVGTNSEGKQVVYHMDI